MLTTFDYAEAEAATSTPLELLCPATRKAQYVSSAPAAKSRWSALRWAIPAAILLAVGAVLFAQWLRTTEPIGDFLTDFDGTTDLPDDAPVGFPAWLAIGHGLNTFLLLFVFRTAWELRGKKRPSAFWTRNNTGLLTTKGAPVRIGIPLWFHLTVDALWVLNGLIYVVLLLATGHWVRIVPTSWEVIPNAVSAGIQYVSLYWPSENGWFNYNSLQLLTYFITVFIASPLAILTGLRLAPGLASKWRRFERMFPRKLAVGTHVAVFFWFIGFTIVHVGLVFATGVLRNLNHMYGGTDEVSWSGAIVFGVLLVLMVVAWVALKPAVVASIAERSGTVRRMPRGGA